MVPHGNWDILLNVNKTDGTGSQLPGSSSEREGLCVRNELREEVLEIERSRELLNGQRDGSCITGF
jgi:hypothetical protein